MRCICGAFEPHSDEKTTKRCFCFNMWCYISISIIIMIQHAVGNLHTDDHVAYISIKEDNKEKKKKEKDGKTKR